MNKNLRITFTVLGVVGVLVLLGILFGRSGWNMTGFWPGSMMGGGMMNGMGPGMMGGGITNGWGSFGWPVMILGWIVNIGLIVGVGLLIVWLVRRVAAPGQGSASPYQAQTGFPTPREVLQTRYARGEITREQYLEILGDLS
jgi:putative membrane protein